jgi:valyl-tRNA synthetase
MTAAVEFGVITSFAYQLEDGSGEIIVATTRYGQLLRVLFAAYAAELMRCACLCSPETMLGDTAVAVHPDDPRCECGASVLDILRHNASEKCS